MTLCGTPIEWKTGRQVIITTSATEAEYVTMSRAAKETVTMARFLMGIKGMGTVSACHNSRRQRALHPNCTQ